MGLPTNSSAVETTRLIEGKLAEGANERVASTQLRADSGVIAEVSAEERSKEGLGTEGKLGIEEEDGDGWRRTELITRPRCQLGWAREVRKRTEERLTEEVSQSERGDSYTTLWRLNCRGIRLSFTGKDKENAH